MHGAGLGGGAGRALATASARNGAREKAQGHPTVLWPAGTPQVTSVSSVLSREFFPIAPVDFQSIGGEGGGAEGDPETRGTSCAIPSWNVPKSIFGGNETEKVSPKVLLDQAIEEKVSPKVSLDQSINEKVY